MTTNQKFIKKVDLHCFKLRWSFLICQMLTKFSGSNPNGPYLGWENEKETFCFVLTYSLKWAHKIRKFHVAVMLQQLRNAQKSVDLHMQSCFFFANLSCLPFSFCQSKLFAVAITKTPYCCYPEILQPWKRDVTLLPSIVKQNSLLLPPHLRKKSW